MDNIGTLLVDAATLMVTGMAVVYLFLTMLVYLVQLMSKLLPAEESPAPVSPPLAAQSLKSTPHVDPKVVAAISSAVHQYRNASAK